MKRGLVLQLGAVVLAVSAFLLAPSRYSVAFAVLGFGIAVAFIAFLVTAPSVQWIVPTIHRGARGRNAIALTLDDGPDPRFTPEVLDLLRAHGAKATFFVVGARVDQHPELARRIVAEGHEIGSHSYSHSLGFHFARAKGMAGELERGIEAIERATGVRPKYFRPPQGLRVPTLRDALLLLDRAPRCVTWTARGFDTGSRTHDAIARRLTRFLVDGAVLTLHDGGGLGGSSDRSPTVRALGTLLARADERGLRCVPLGELLAPPLEPRGDGALLAGRS